MKGMISMMLLFLILQSCNSKKVFDERHNFEDMKWNRFKNVTFEFDISDTESLYDMTMSLRHHTVFPEPDLQMTLAIYTPSGERRLKDITMVIRNADGTFRASGMGDLWDMDQVVYSGYHFNEKGHYKVEIENRMSKYDTPGVMELGLRVEKVGG
ncbi:MAG: hypothetical protein WCO63_04270 [Bacteroidota bacterium]